MSDFVIDTFAWIEYFLGSEAGMKAGNYIESKNAITPSIVIAELSHKYSREKIDFSDKLKFILFNSRIADLDAETANEAGIISTINKKKSRNWGMADSIILATSLKFNAKVVAGNEHFRDIENVIMIK